MKKKSDKRLQVHISSDVEEIFQVIKRPLPEPFTRRMLSLLREANPLRQTYYYIERESDYAFFTVYENRMNLLTFGKAQWFMNVQTIAFPCSLSCGGYVTNNMQMMLEYIKTIRGCKLVLNVEGPAAVRGMAFGETLPTCRLTLRPEHTSLDGYLASLRSSYRRRIRLAIKNCADVTIRQIGDDSVDVHPLYLQTYEKSDYKLERLEREFFDKAGGDKLVFFRGDKPVGFVLLKKTGDELVFMLCGMDYHQAGPGIDSPGIDAPDCNADLYYYMLLQIVGYAIRHRCKTIDFGQTSEKTKLKFGAQLEKRYFYAHHTNPFLNLVALLGRHILEYSYDFPAFHVFKEPK